MVDLSIGVVTYNNGEEICNLLSSIYKYISGITYEVYVVDNVSSDDTVNIVKENFPNVNIVMSKANNGFGSGHNHLLNVNSRYHIIINPDIIIDNNVFKCLVEYMDENNDCVLVTPKILNEDGTEQLLPKRSPTAKYMLLGRLSNYIKPFEKYRDEYTMKGRKFNNPTEIEFCTGCFMMLRTEIWKKLGGFDERFFMYLEDADLSDRARKYGKVIFNPNYSVVHKWERGSSKNYKLLKIHFQSMFKYLKKKKQIN